MDIGRELEKALEMKREERRIIEELRELQSVFRDRFSRNPEFLMKLMDYMPDTISINWTKVQRRLR